MPSTSRWLRLIVLALIFAASATTRVVAVVDSDPLGSWNDGDAKRAILALVRATTDRASPTFVRPEERVATFDEDGTLWVERPVPTQLVYCLERVPTVVAARPELTQVEPFKTVLTGDRAAVAKLSKADLEKIVAATLAGMSVEAFTADVKRWMATARDPRWKRPFGELVYQPMVELMKYLRRHGFKTYIVTGGGQDFVRAFAEALYDVPPEQVVGTAGGVSYEHDAMGKPILMKDPKMLLLDDGAGKVEGIHLMIGRRPSAAFGNSTGDRQMLEYTSAGGGARLAMLVLHDDAVREYAYGPAFGLPDTKLGRFPQELFAEADRSRWIVVSMKRDFGRVFAFEALASR